MCKSRMASWVPYTRYKAGWIPGNRQMLTFPHGFHHCDILFPPDTTLDADIKRLNHYHERHKAFLRPLLFCLTVWKFGNIINSISYLNFALLFFLSIIPLFIATLHMSVSPTAIITHISVWRQRLLNEVATPL